MRPLSTARHSSACAPTGLPGLLILRRWVSFMGWPACVPVQCLAMPLLSTPYARYWGLGTQRSSALSDGASAAGLDWQAQTRTRLQRDSQRLANILQRRTLPLGGTALFQSVCSILQRNWPIC